MYLRTTDTAVVLLAWIAAFCLLLFVIGICVRIFDRWNARRPHKKN